MRTRNSRISGGTGKRSRHAYHALKAAGYRPHFSHALNVLVTGGAGYIGSHTCKALAEAGYCPVVLDNLTSGHRWAVKWGPFIKGDLNDRTLLLKVMKEYQIRAVIHFAAYAYVGESMAAPGKYFRNNISNTINLLDAMVAAQVKHLVFSSSCATYGIPYHIPISESHPQHPINPYGESKLFVEKALHWYEAAHGVQYYALRYFNAAGDDPDGQIGEDHDPETHLIPLVIQTALSQRSEVKIFGTDFDTPDGSAVRDYIHVRDLAGAHVLALKQLLSGSVSRCLNLGTGNGQSVREVIDTVENISGLSVNAIEAPCRPGDPAMLIAAPEAALELLDWKPRYSDLETIVSSALSWHSKQTRTSAEGKGVKLCRVTVH